MKTIRKTRSEKSSLKGLKRVGDKPVQSPSFQEAIDQFLEYHPALRLSTNLRRMLIDFLQFDGATEARYLQDLLYDLQGLFEVLEALENGDQP